MTDVTSSEPITIETPKGKHSVTLRPFATARLRKATRGVFLRYASMDTKMIQGKTKEQIKNMDTRTMTKLQDEIPAEITEEIKENTIKFMVIKIKLADGTVIEDKEQFIDTCLDMEDEDFNFIVKRADEIAGSTELDEAEKKA